MPGHEEGERTKKGKSMGPIAVPGVKTKTKKKRKQGKGRGKGGGKAAGKLSSKGAPKAPRAGAPAGDGLPALPSPAVPKREFASPADMALLRGGGVNLSRTPSRLAALTGATEPSGAEAGAPEAWEGGNPGSVEPEGVSAWSQTPPRSVSFAAPAPAERARAQARADVAACGGSAVREGESGPPRGAMSPTAARGAALFSPVHVGAGKRASTDARSSATERRATANPAASPTGSDRRRAGGGAASGGKESAAASRGMGAGAVPETRIPRSDWIMSSSPLADEEGATFDPKSGRFVARVFPAVNVLNAGRDEIMALEDWLDTREQLDRALTSTEAETEGDGGSGRAAGAAASGAVDARGRTPSQMSRVLAVATRSAIDALRLFEADIARAHAVGREIDRQRQTYDIAMHELVRHNLAKCVERGLLMARVWAQRSSALSELLDVTGPLAFAVRTLRSIVAEKQTVIERMLAAGKDATISDLRAQLAKEYEAHQATKAELKDTKTLLWATEGRLEMLQQMSKVHAEMENQRQEMERQSQMIKERDHALEVQRRQNQMLVNKLKEVREEASRELERAGMANASNSRYDAEIERLHRHVADLRAQLRESQLRMPDELMNDERIRNLLRVIQRLRRAVQDTAEIMQRLQSKGRELSSRATSQGSPGMARVTPSHASVQASDSDSSGTEAREDSDAGEEESKTEALMGHVAFLHDDRPFTLTTVPEWCDIMAKGAILPKTADASVQFDPDDLPSGKVRAPKARKSKALPPMWSQLLKGVRKGGKTSWTLAKMKTVVLDIFVEKLKQDSIDAGMSADSVALDAFTVGLFWTRYGIKKLVQRRLRDVLAAARQYKQDIRVSYFVRGVGLWEESISDAEMAQYLMFLKTVLLDQLAKFESGTGSGAKMWHNDDAGATWIPLRVATDAVTKLFRPRPGNTAARWVKANVATSFAAHVKPRAGKREGKTPKAAASTGSMRPVPKAGGDAESRSSPGSGSPLGEPGLLEAAGQAVGEPASAVTPVAGSPVPPDSASPLLAASQVETPAASVVTVPTPTAEELAAGARARAIDDKVRQLLAACRALPTAAAPTGTSSSAIGSVRVNLDDVLELFMEEWRSTRTNDSQRFKEVFEEVDEDHNGLLDEGEFMRAVNLLALKPVPEQSCRMLYVRTVSENECEFLNLEDFVHLCSESPLLRRLCSDDSAADADRVGAGRDGERCGDGDAGSRAGGAAGGSPDSASLFRVVSGRSDSAPTPSEVARKQRSRDAFAEVVGAGESEAFERMAEDLMAVTSADQLDDLYEAWQEHRPEADRMISARFMSPALRVVMLDKVETIEEGIEELRDCLEDETRKGLRKAKELQQLMWEKFARLVKCVRHAEDAERELAQRYLRRWARTFVARRATRVAASTGTPAVSEAAPSLGPPSSRDTAAGGPAVADSAGATAVATTEAAAPVSTETAAETSTEAVARASTEAVAQASTGVDSASPPLHVGFTADVNVSVSVVSTPLATKQLLAELPPP